MTERKHHAENAQLGMNRAFVPDVVLGQDETEIARYQADTITFWRSQAWMAVFFAVIGAGILFAMGNPHWWTGIVGAFAAIAVRALYLGSDERKMVWVLTDFWLYGPAKKLIAVENITKVNVLWTAVQVVTLDGTKHLIRYQADPEAVKQQIETAAGKA